MGTLIVTYLDDVVTKYDKVYEPHSNSEFICCETENNGIIAIKISVIRSYVYTPNATDNLSSQE